ncbi:hypothetical protein JR316_0005806 [Psilocybe cubensis]|uniref:Uncharacterized protein n=2 Tax=Psilocybe cubensis TaxID=181762 RepID=A0ACB8H0B3_PSICU|nr:hypothetical protein JR316_0005806 [Psilocybe cubensis]KAH9481284.1 hypothetical protein JR316_0005806 [Psilocybe cubensis]
MSKQVFLNGGVRQCLKHTLFITKVKLLYDKITLNRFTTLYFFSAVLGCFILTSLQAVSLAHDSEACSALSSVIEGSPRLDGLAILKGNAIELCSGLPDQSGTVCVNALKLQNSLRTASLTGRDEEVEDDDDDDDVYESDVEDSDDEDDDEDDGDKDEDDDDDDDIPVGDQLDKIDISLPPIGAPVPSSTNFPLTGFETLTISDIFQTIVTKIPLPSLSITSEISSGVPITSISPTVASTTIFASSSSIAQTTSSRLSQSSTSSVPGPVITGTPTSSSSIDISFTTASTTTSAAIPQATKQRATDDFFEVRDECLVSVMWLNDILHDARREDIVLFVFQFWLLLLSFVTILNESIPHLGAGLLGHLLGTAWAAYRVHFTKSLMDQYRNEIIPNACDGRDFMGNWWEDSIKFILPLVVFQSLALLVVAYLSYKLFKVYAHQTFNRAGASPKVNRIYKLVLMFSVCLQLSSFISVASAGMWINKVSHGALAVLAKHAKLYLAGFIVTLVLQIPWLIIGWVCVRRECRIRFFIFCFISTTAFSLSITMFSSNIYRYIFSTWPFFATITITAFVLLVGTTVLGIICRLHFGEGLAHYLQVTEALEGVNFTPVYFTNDSKSDIEKPEIVPQLTRLTPDGKHVVELPVPIYATNPAGTRGVSVYSDTNASPILLSSSPPLESDLISNNRSSMFSRVLKRFSSRVPSPSAQSFKVEPTPSRKNGLLSPDAASRSIKHTSMQSEKVLSSLNGSRLTPPSSPMETLSVVSYGSNQPSISSDRSADTHRSRGPPPVRGLPANPRSRSFV